MLPILQLGPLTIQTPGLILLAAVWIGLSASERAARRQNQDPGALDSLALTALLVGLLGARISFALQNLSAFRGSPLGLLALTPAMLDPIGGLVAAVLAGFIYGQRKKLVLWPTLDLLTPGLAVLAVGIGLAHLAAGDAFGAPTSLPWGIWLWGETRQPSQIYEIVASLGITLLVWPRAKRDPFETETASQYPAGMRFLAFMALSAGARLFLEAFRGDSQLVSGSLRIAQLVAWLVLALCLLLIGKKFGSNRRRDQHGSDFHQ